MSQCLLTQVLASVPTACISVPPALAAQLVLRRWTELLVPGTPCHSQVVRHSGFYLKSIWCHWHPRPQGFALADAEIAPTPDILAQLGKETTKAGFQHAADVMRQLLQHETALIPQNLRTEACLALHFLQLQHDLRDPHLTKLQGVRAQQYDALFLVQCLLMAVKLRNASDLEQVLGVGLSALSPTRDIQEQVQSWTQTMPSASTISRHQLTLLTGWALYNRLQDALPEPGAQGLGARQSCMRFLLLDSSPQGAFAKVLDAKGKQESAENQ